MTQELLGRVHRELLDVLNSINQDKIHHDGDDFHELLNDVEKALAQPEQEPVISKWVLREVYFDEDGEPTMHRSTPQRKPLTDEEIINKCLESGFERNCLGWSFTYGKLDYHLLKLARAIEAAHNIKENT